MVGVHEGDNSLINCVRDTGTRVILNQTGMETRCLQSLIIGALWLDAMKGDTGVNIPSFLPKEDMVNVACTVRDTGDNV